MTIRCALPMTGNRSSRQRGLRPHSSPDFAQINRHPIISMDSYVPTARHSQLSRTSDAFIRVRRQTVEVDFEVVCVKWFLDLQQLMSRGNKPYLPSSTSERASSLLDTFRHPALLSPPRPPSLIRYLVPALREHSSKPHLLPRHNRSLSDMETVHYLVSVVHVSLETGLTISVSFKVTSVTRQLPGFIKEPLTGLVGKVRPTLPTDTSFVPGLTSAEHRVRRVMIPSSTTSICPTLIASSTQSPRD